MGTELLQTYGVSEVAATEGAAFPLRDLEPLFKPAAHTASVDTDALTSRQCWPSFSPQSALGLAAMRLVLRRAHEDDSWGDIGGSWVSCLLAAGTVYSRKTTLKDKLFWLSLGNVGGLAVISWPLRRLTLKKQVFYLVGSEREAPVEPQWDVIFHESEVVVWPTLAVSPAHMQYLVQGTCAELGVVLQQTGVHVSLYAHAASHGFWRLPRSALERVATGLNVDPEGGDDLTLLEKLMQTLLPRLAPAEVTRILANRPAGQDMSGVHVPEEVLEAVLGESDAAEVSDRWAIKVNQ